MPQTIADRIMRNRHWLDQFAGDLHKQMSDGLKEAQKELIDEMMSPELDKLTRRHHKKMLKEVTQILQDAYGEFPNIIDKGMINTAKHEYYDVANAIRDAKDKKRIPITAKNSGLPTEAIKELQTMPIGGSLLEDWVKKQYTNAETGIKSVFNQSLIRGLSMPRTAKLLRDRIGMSNREANVLARTAVMEASNRALDRVYEDHESLIDGYEYLATLDNSTCVVCGPLDGKRKKKRSEFDQPPLHPQCRCIISPIVELEGLEDAQRFETIRDPKTGKIIHKEKISGKIKYSEWFDKQDEDFQRQVLGKTRFELYKQGNLKLKQMSDATIGQILTIDQLDKKYKLGLKEKKESPKMLKIMENTTNLEMKIWEKEGKKRVYINKKANVLAHDVYFDFNEGCLKFKATNKKIKETSSGWQVEKINEGFKVFTTHKFLKKYFTIIEI